MAAIPLTDDAVAEIVARHDAFRTAREYVPLIDLEGELGLSCSTSCGRDCSTVLGCAPTDGEPLREQSTTTTDPVTEPAHYTWLPGGVEAIDITQHLNYCLGNVVKYAIRCDHKGTPMQDLYKALDYLQIEIARREAQQ